MVALLKPRYGVPVHGEYRMLVEHARLAVSMGTPQENVIVAQDGDIIEASARDGIRIVDHVPSGNVFGDGLGVGDVGQVVLRDRKALSQDGILVVVVTVNAETGEPIGGPDIISPGFVYERGPEELMGAARARVSNALRQARQAAGPPAHSGFLKNKEAQTPAQVPSEKLNS